MRSSPYDRQDRWNVRTVHSGDLEITIRAEERTREGKPEFGPRHVWRVRTQHPDGSQTSVVLGQHDVGGSVESLRAAADGNSDVALLWSDKGPSFDRSWRFALLRRGTVVTKRTLGGERRTGDLRLFDARDGWYIAGEREDDGRAIVWSLDRDGGIRGKTVVGLGLPEERHKGMLVAKGHGGMGIAFEWHEDGVAKLGFRRVPDRDESPRPVTVDEDGALAAKLTPLALVPAQEGWWLAAAATWQSSHFASALPQLRFIRLKLDGTPTGRVHTRLQGHIGKIDELAATAGGLRFRHEYEGMIARYRLVSSGPCAATAPDRCEPRTRFRQPRTDGYAWGLFDAAGRRIRDPHLGFEPPLRLWLTRYDESGEPRWRTQMPPQQPGPAPGINGSGLAIVDGQGLAFVTEREEDRLRVLGFEPSQGDVLFSQVMGPAPDGTCVAADGSRPYVGATSRSAQELRLYRVDKSGKSSVLGRVAGEWVGCGVAVLEDRIVVAANRADIWTSAGPETSLHIHVFSRDGSLVETHSPDAAGHGVRAHANETGVTLVWTGRSHWAFFALRLDANGRPQGEPYLRLPTIGHVSRGLKPRRV